MGRDHVGVDVRAAPIFVHVLPIKFDGAARSCSVAPNNMTNGHQQASDHAAVFIDLDL
ncbi:MAG TPA: hypothetical protein VMM13_00245 [Euzebya sp.]|nr:hypothetical protein [Euzebya sp.]